MKTPKRFFVALIFLVPGVCYGQTLKELPAPSRPSTNPSVKDEVSLPPGRRDVYVEQYHPTKSEKQLLTPSTNDLDRFADFLRQPDSGLIKIFPENRRGVVSVQQLERAQSPGFINFASTYSFTKTKHGQSLQGYVDPGLGWGEIKFDADALTTAFTRSSIGLLVSLGDVPLEKITVATAGAAAIADFKPPRDFTEERQFIRACREGFQFKGFVYRASLPATVNNTYVLRSINNERADIFVALRIIREDEDGSLTMLWRKLKTNPKPSWKRKP
jgi:hypothetical protein